MRIQNHICFRTSDYPDFIRYLYDEGIPFDWDDNFSVIEIYEDDPNWSNVEIFVKKYKLFRTFETHYANEEITSAPWLYTWCRWRCGYPQPELVFTTENTTYSIPDECRMCGSGAVQIAPFRIKKTPKWGKRAFMELNWIGDELFLSGSAKQVLETNGITGISFEKVLSKNGKETLEDVFQMKISTILPAGLVEEKTCLTKSYICPACGQKKFVPSGRGQFAYRKEIFDNAPDVVKTAEIWGDMHYAVRMICIRQNVYQTIVQNKLDRGLVFEPLLLV